MFLPLCLSKVSTSHWQARMRRSMPPPDTLQVLPLEIVKVILHHATRPEPTRALKKQRRFSFSSDILPKCCSYRISTALALSLTSTWLRLASAEFLVESVCLVGLPRMEQFLAALHGHSLSGIHTKELSLYLYHMEGIDREENVRSALMVSARIVALCPNLKTLDLQNFLLCVGIQRLRAEASLFVTLWEKIPSCIQSIAVPSSSHIPFLLKGDLHGLRSFVEGRRSLVSWQVPVVEYSNCETHLGALLQNTESLCFYALELPRTVIPCGLCRLKRLEVGNPILKLFGAVFLPELEDLHYQVMPPDEELQWALTSLPSLKSIEYHLLFPGHTKDPWIISPFVSDLRCVTIHLDHRVVVEERWGQAFTGSDASRQAHMEAKRREVRRMFGGLDTFYPVLNRVVIHCDASDGPVEGRDTTCERISREIFSFLQSTRCEVSVHTGIDSEQRWYA